MTVENSTVPLHDSEEWCRLLDVNVLDPDGWDRMNLVESWAEQIDEKEFWRRYSRSTIPGEGYVPSRFAPPADTEQEETHEVYENQPTLFEKMRHQIAEDIIQKMLLAVPPTPGNIAHVKKVAEEYGVDIDFDH